MRLTIRKHRVVLDTTDIYGNTAYYDAVDCGPKGKVIAEIEGDIAPVDGGTMIEMAGDRWRVCDILDFARRGEHGLRVVA